jgi:hypothetical protein
LPPPGRLVSLWRVRRPGSRRRQTRRSRMLNCCPRSLLASPGATLAHCRAATRAGI